MERTIVNNVLKFLNEADGCKAIKIHGSIYQQRGTPDILVCYHGRFILFEMKQPGKTRSNIQRRVCAQWRRAGAIVESADSLDRVKEVMKDVALGKYDRPVAQS